MKVANMNNTKHQFIFLLFIFYTYGAHDGLFIDEEKIICCIQLHVDMYVCIFFVVKILVFCNSTKYNHNNKKSASAAKDEIK